MPDIEASLLLTPQSIGELTERVRVALKERDVDARATHHVILVLEELLTNLERHAEGKDASVSVALTVEPSQVTGRLLDRNPPFDPQQLADPDITAPLHDRQVGGLGLYLVRKLTTALEYSSHNGQNATTFAVARAVSDGADSVTD